MSAVCFIAWGMVDMGQPPVRREDVTPEEIARFKAMKKAVRAELQAKGYFLEGGTTSSYFTLGISRKLLERKPGGRGRYVKRTKIYTGNFVDCCKAAAERLYPAGNQEAA
jgi:hypothetical protein